MNREDLCFKAADVMIPVGCDMSRWSVVACDQYTSEPEYWEETERIVGGAPSSLRVVLPEAYLESGDIETRIENINRTMADYIEGDLFKTLPSTFILVERRFPGGKTRFGVIGMVDLEHYDYNPGAESLIRATEGTVLSRLPPRVKVRENAPIELPHIMLLVDDPERTVIEPATAMRRNMRREYDFALMQNGGHITGYSLMENTAEELLGALSRLSDPQVFNGKYGTEEKPVLLFASGDGNHSLATAKQCWEKAKTMLSDEEIKSSPKRYALVELVNLHDESLEFEAIHRVVFETDPERLLSELFEYCPGARCGGEGKGFDYVTAAKSGRITGIGEGLAVGVLQDFLDEYIAKNGGRIDYIHGLGVAESLARTPGSIGFLLEAMEKDELFRAVIDRGVLPRKTFSMGEAHEKRYYLEARKII